MAHSAKKPRLDGEQWPSANVAGQSVDVISDGVPGFTAMVNLNVGGVTYTTTYRTLTRHTGSRFDVYFRELFNHLKHGAPTSNLGDDFLYVADERSGPHPTVFIDRDGRRFEYILDYLRDGDVALPEDVTLRRQLLQDARYFRLPELENTIAYMLAPENTHAQTHVMTPSRKITTVSPDRMMLDRMYSIPTDKSKQMSSRCDGHGTQSPCNLDSSRGHLHNYDDANSLFFSQRSYDDEGVSSQKSYLQMEESDNIEESGVFVQTTPVAGLGKIEFSTSVDF
ncbi:BTB/POZ domain-containing protein KCTD8 [Babesia sp. Xinjiang]|uniref:BTB/POZ domain-containing protein KCTD8 n=1 Tax=Babesia sp. Xinjiang TaxID=462227 RepID=UPI000A24B33E|nr:BTB/POZ domain-containing protein KCTD8 [Babesia sp. Xinjiang]ORM40671.1 BTB/POZ domain-containing protein KCTD8 [Babesia sp. Xinjiang]